MIFHNKKLRLYSAILNTFRLSFSSVFDSQRKRRTNLRVEVAIERITAVSHAILTLLFAPSFLFFYIYIFSFSTIHLHFRFDFNEKSATTLLLSRNYFSIIFNLLKLFVVPILPLEKLTKTLLYEELSI